MVLGRVEVWDVDGDGDGNGMIVGRLSSGNGLRFVGGGLYGSEKI